MGQIKVIGQDELSEGINSRIGNNTNTAIPDLYQSNNISEPLTKSISMFDWQYELQKKLQNPIVVSQSDNKGIRTKKKKRLIKKWMKQKTSKNKVKTNLSL